MHTVELRGGWINEVVTLLNILEHFFKMLFLWSIRMPMVSNKQYSNCLICFDELFSLDFCREFFRIEVLSTHLLNSQTCSSKSLGYFTLLEQTDSWNLKSPFLLKKA